MKSRSIKVLRKIISRKKIIIIISIERDDRRKLSLNESRIWFIDDLASEIKCRSFIFEYIREDFLDKALRIKLKETTDLKKITIP